MADTLKILLAVDGSPFSDAAVRLIVQHYRSDNVEVQVLHAVDWLRELPDSFRFGEGPTYAQQILERREASFERGRALVARVAGELRAAGFNATTATLDAEARRAIVDTARQWPADLIVIGSHGRTGIDRFLLGSVAESVMRHTPCSVEIVREPKAS
ncbi:MAG: universal stress protein [Acidobacteriota bacterium]